jgi:DNA-binding MurR/RpiR family transcriptional regulator
VLLENFVREGIGALESLLESVDEGALEQAVSVLDDADQIFVLGQGRAFPIAFYLGFALTRLERRSVLLDGIGGMQVQRQQAELASTGDALIAVSFRPYTPLVVEIAAEKKEKGVPVIAITDSQLSPLAEHATVLLEVQEDGERIFLSLIAPMCLAQTLMVSLGQKMAASGQPKS